MTELQEKILEIYKCVSKICEQNKIQYFAIGGTCIGAIRHSGFIPWDDDLDIAVPIEQFELLKEALKNELPKNMSYIDCNTMRHFHYIFGKVQNNNTTFIEYRTVEFKDSYKGVYMDIMPMSGLPSNKYHRWIFMCELKLIYILNVARRFPIKSHPKMLSSFTFLLFKILACLFPLNFFSDLYIKKIKKYPMYKAKYVGYVWWPAEIERLTFSSEWFLNRIEKQFENTKIYCPAGYDAYLKHQFGDYMTIPSEEDRVVHPSFVDLDNSYLKYQQGELSISGGK